MNKVRYPVILVRAIGILF